MCAASAALPIPDPAYFYPQSQALLELEPLHLSFDASVTLWQIVSGRLDTQELTYLLAVFLALGPCRGPQAGRLMG